MHKGHDGGNAVAEGVGDGPKGPCHIGQYAKGSNDHEDDSVEHRLTGHDGRDRIHLLDIYTQPVHQLFFDEGQLGDGRPIVLGHSLLQHIGADEGGG